MAVQHIKLRHTNRSGTLDATGATAFTTYVEEYDVLCTDRQDNAALIIFDGLAPKAGQSYPNDPAARLRTLRVVSAFDDQFTHGLVAEYSSKGTSDAQSPELQNNVNPLNRPPDIQWGQIFHQEAMDKDENGLPLRNSATDPFDPPIPKNIVIGTLQFTRNETNFNLGQSNMYANTVNSDVWNVLGFTAPPQQALCASITGSKHYEAGTSYYQVTYEFHFKLAGWRLPVLDQGFRHLKPLPEPLFGNVLVSFKDTEGVQFQTPSLLNGAGFPLYPDGVPVTPVPVYLPLNSNGFVIYKELPFAALNIPSTP